MPFVMNSEAETPALGSAAQLQTRFLAKRKVMEKLCAPLSDEDCMVSSTSDTSPPKWHLAHTTWFYEHFILKAFQEGFRPFDESFEYLFNSYYQGVGKFLPKSQRGFLSRPSLDQVYRYRAQVNEAVSELILKCSDEVLKKISPLIELGIHHEQQHQELLLMDIKQNFFLHPSRPAYAPEPTAPAMPAPKARSKEFLDFTGGLIEVGNNQKTFHYDNEGGRHRMWLEPFQLASQLVTNQEFVEFIQDGGYEDPQYWLSDGWDTVQKNGWKHPLYWEKSGSSYRVMTLNGMKELIPDEPVSHISYYEAQAYANYRGARLPTEFEWEHAASFEDASENFMEEQIYHPLPKAAIHGGLWEWTQSAYLPYPGYQAFAQELGEYNSKFMCNQFVLRGGSCVTPRSHYRITYRNFYYPHHRWQFSGFRLAKDKQ